METLYSVEGRTFRNGEHAEWFARGIAVRENRKVEVMEKVDGMAWHRVATITAE